MNVKGADGQTADGQRWQMDRQMDGHSNFQHYTLPLFL